MDVVVYFGGGGALGAFDAGVWRELAPRLRAAGARLLAVGGASIGALNAACIARHGADWSAGASALEGLWTRELATPSFPFDPTAPFGERLARSWNGVLTGLLLGNRRLYRSEPMRWNPVAGLQRRHQPLMDRSRMHDWLERCIGPVPVASADMPLLGAAAVDVHSGELLLIDNASGPVPPAALAASSAIPLLFEPVELDGRLLWDGDMVRDSALPLLLDRARAHRGAARTPLMLVAVDHMCRAMASTPRSGLEMTHRALELLLQGKTVVDDAALAGVDHVLRIERSPLPHDPVSGQFDYSPERIAELVAQGAAQARAAWRDAPERCAA